ncbi:MAG: ISAzo13-like element transposase-related protein, partial [Chthoniobacterales bacterium]
ITMNWRGRPLTSHEVMVELIAATTNASGLKVCAGIDRSSYPTGQKVTKAQMRSLHLQRDPFHDEWNYVITPSPD